MEDFRFWTVARKYAFAKSKINIREAIPENIDGSNTQDVKTGLENAKADTKKLQKKKKKITKKQTKTIKDVYKRQVQTMRDCSVVTATYELGDGMKLSLIHI